MPTLFLRLKSVARRDDEGLHLTSEWLIREDDGSDRATGSTDFRGLTDLIDPSADWLQDPRNIVVLVPTEHALSLSCVVPGRSTAQIRRALPFVVEEFVATDIEAMHLAHGPIKRAEPVAVNLIDGVLLEDWLACLQEIGLSPGFLVAETELLPISEDAASVLLDGDFAEIRTTQQAAAIDRDNLLLALGAAEVSHVTLINGALSDIERGQLDPDMTIEQSEDRWASALDYLAGRWPDSQASAVNLLQGKFAPPKPKHQRSGRWRAVAALAAVWAFVGALGMVAQGIWASMQADTLQARSETLYRDIYPDEQRIINVRRQMQQKLGQRSADGQDRGFMEYLGFLAQGIDRSASILSLNFTQTRDELAADLLLQNYDELERMKQRLNQLNVEVEITSAEQQDSGVRARIRLKGA